MTIQRRFLLGSHWTSRKPLPECHFEVIAVARESVTLRAILTRRDCEVPIAELDDVEAWATGWLSL